VSHEYEAYITRPLFTSITLLALVTCAFLLWGARLTRGNNRRQASTLKYVGDTLVDFPWPIWVLLVTVVFLLANQLLVRGVAVGRWDVDGQFYPYYVLVADHARAARFVQWDPWSNGGLPMLGDPQVGVFSPMNFVLGLLTGGTSWGFRVYWLLVWWVGGFGMLMLGRHLGAPPWGACVVALGFLFCGVYTGNAEHTPWIAAFSFLPLTIWRLDVSLRSRTLRPAAEAGAVWGLSALAGYPGVIVITGCFAALWTLGRGLVPQSRGAECAELSCEPESAGTRLVTPGFALSSLLLVLLVGVFVLAPTYFAFFFEGAGISPRVGALTRDLALSNSLEPGATATFASPYLTALKAIRQFMSPDVAPGRLWPATDLSMVNIYAGAVIPSLALFALVRRPRDSWRWWVACMAVLSLASALGDALPVRGWLYDWFYPMRFFRHAAIFRLYYVFAICVLALLATRDLAADLRHPTPGARSRFLVASMLVGSCAVLAAIPFVDPAWSSGLPEKAVLLGRVHFVWVWLGVCGVAFLGWQLPIRWSEWCVPALLVALAASDTLLTTVLSIPTLLSVGESAQRWKNLDGQHRSTLDLTRNGLWRKESSCEPDLPSVRCRRNDQLITKVPVFNSYSTEKNIFHLAMVQDPVLKGMATGAERVWFSKEVAHVPPTEGWFAAFRSRAEILGVPPLVVHSPHELLRRSEVSPASDVSAGGLATINRLPAAHLIRARVLRYFPEELVLDVNAPTDGWLLVTDRWARSWRGEINGRQTTVYGGNFIFRAIRVYAGQNRVRFTYQAAGFPWLVIVSWGTLTVVALCSLRFDRTHRWGWLGGWGGQ
jgi:hypothetical protein